LILLALLATCGPGGPRLEFDGARVLEAKVPLLSAGSCACETGPVVTTSPVFMSIHNRGGQADRLLKVETKGAVKVSLSKASDPQDLSSSQAVETIEIPPGGSAVFGDGPYAMLLTGLRGDLVPGQTLALTLHFEKSGTLSVEAAITTRE
jgi:copper(I)-binding protein